MKSDSHLVTGLVTTEGERELRREGGEKEREGRREGGKGRKGSGGGREGEREG